MAICHWYTGDNWMIHAPVTANQSQEQTYAMRWITWYRANPYQLIKNPALAAVLNGEKAEEMINED
jgi:hypothetical protein